MGIEEFNLTCPIVDTPDGTPIRDYVDVVDLIEAHYLANEFLYKGGISEEINLGSGQGNSVEEIVSTVERVLNTVIERKRTEPRKGEYAKVYADTSKAHNVLNWYPKHSIEDSIKNLENWYKNYPTGFEN
jgi:UDP-glucose 4-epimerase